MPSTDHRSPSSEAHDTYRTYTQSAFAHGCCSCTRMAVYQSQDLSNNNNIRALPYRAHQQPRPHSVLLQPPAAFQPRPHSVLLQPPAFFSMSAFRVAWRCFRRDASLGATPSRQAKQYFSALPFSVYRPVASHFGVFEHPPHRATSTRLLRRLARNAIFSDASFPSTGSTI